MMRRAFATLVVASGIIVGAQGLAVGATSSNCRTVNAIGSDTSNPPKSVVAHVCDRIKIGFVFGTQGPIVPQWGVTRQPSKKVLKFVSRGFGGNDPSGQTAEQDIVYRAVGTGKTSIAFRETSPGNGTLETFTMKVTVLPHRPGGTGSTGATGTT